MDELSNVVECKLHRGLQYRFWDRLLRVYAVIGDVVGDDRVVQAGCRYNELSDLNEFEIFRTLS